MTRRMKFDHNNAEHLHAGWRWESARVPLLMSAGRKGEAMDAEAAARNHWRRYQDLCGGQES